MTMNLPCNMQSESEIKRAAKHCCNAYVSHLDSLSSTKPLTSRSLKIQAAAIGALANRLEELEAKKLL